MADWSDLVGMVFADAEDKARRYGSVLRITSLNDKPVVGTRDYRTDRVNVAVKHEPNGPYIVIAIKGVG